MRVLIKYGSHKQHEVLVAIETIGIVDGQLVLGFTKTDKGFIYGKTLANSDVVAYFA